MSLTNAMHLGTEFSVYHEDEELRNYVHQNHGNLESINQYTESKFIVDSTINPHPRFGNIAKCIRQRRGEKVNITVPLFKDKNTDMDAVTEQDPYPGQIYMDSMPFGMG